MSREQILSNLRTSLASNRAWLLDEAGKAAHDAPPYVLPPADDLAAQFAAELGKLDGRVYRVSDNEEAIDQLGAILADKVANEILAWDLDEIQLPGIVALLAANGTTLLDASIHGADRQARLQCLEAARVCISGVEVGIAESGSLVLRHGPGRPRLASLLAPYHVAVLRADQLVRGLGEALALLRARHGANLFTDTSNLTFITGPSRTADIEMTLALGIHGPQEIHVVLIDTPTNTQ